MINAQMLDICLVDDDDICLFFHAWMIETSRIPATIHKFTNGIDLLTHLRTAAMNGKKLPDIILLDISMPLLSGWETIEEIEKMKFPKPEFPDIYMCSSSTLDYDKKRAADVIACKGLITKPLRRVDLMGIFEQRYSSFLP